MSHQAPPPPLPSHLKRFENTVAEREETNLYTPRTGFCVYVYIHELSLPLELKESQAASKAAGCNASGGARTQFPIWLR